MLIILPLIALILLFFVCQIYQKDYRISFIYSLVTWGLILTVITEFLNIFNLLNSVGLGISWLAVGGLLLAFYRYRRRQLPRLAYTFKELTGKLRDLPLPSFLLLLGVAWIAVWVGVVAIVGAPNNWDSMIYHLSRVVHWQQNESIAHYPTHTVSQLYQNPWAEWVIFHFQILGQSDRWANLVQWGSMVGSLVGVSLIANQLGVRTRGQVLAVVFAATIPMGVLQASSTQNDYVVTFWLVCLAYFTLQVIQKGATLENTVGVGITLGLAILTKGTAYIYALPFCLWLGVWGLKNLKWQLVKSLAIVSALVLGINLGHFWRNFNLFSSILGVPEESIQASMTLPIWLSNIIRNLSLHADIVGNLNLTKFLTRTTGITEKIVIIVHEFLGLDPGDPLITSPPGVKFHIPAASFHEDTAGNSVHLALILIACLLLLINKNIRKEKLFWSYGLTLIFGFVLACYFLNWSPWRSRLHLPLFVLFAPWFAGIFYRAFNEKITTTIAVILLLIIQPWVFQNKMKPLAGANNIFTTPRIEQFWVNRRYLKEPYIRATSDIRKRQCSHIGLTGDNTSYEYPLWVLLKQNNSNSSAFTLSHLNIKNASSILEDAYSQKKGKPCAIIAINSKNNYHNSSPILATKQGVYEQAWSDNGVQLLLPKPIN